MGSTHNYEDVGDVAQIVSIVESLKISDSNDKVPISSNEINENGESGGNTPTPPPDTDTDITDASGLSQCSPVSSEEFCCEYQCEPHNHPNPPPTLNFQGFIPFPPNFMAPRNQTPHFQPQPQGPIPIRIPINPQFRHRNQAQQSIPRYFLPYPLMPMPMGPQPMSPSFRPFLPSSYHHHTQGAGPGSPPCYSYQGPVPLPLPVQIQNSHFQTEAINGFVQQHSHSPSLHGHGQQPEPQPQFVYCNQPGQQFPVQVPLQMSMPQPLPPFTVQVASPFPSSLLMPMPQPFLLAEPPQEPPTTKYCELFYSLREVDSHNSKNFSEEIISFSQLSFFLQLNHFQVAMAISQPAFEKRLQLIRDLKEVISAKYPKCQIHPFGSFFTGLGDDKSDLDISVDVFNSAGAYDGTTEAISFEHWNERTQQVLNDCVDLLFPSETTKPSEEPKSDFDSDSSSPDKGKIKICVSLEAVREARVPIIKFTHWTGLKCDLSFENITSLRNSLLISFYMKLHPLVKPLLVVVRYWATFHKLMGYQRIKSYCVVLLVLTFLMSTQVIPPVWQLQQIKEYERLLLGIRNTQIVDDWDTSFSDYIPSIQSSFPSSIYIGHLENEDIYSSIFLNLLRNFFKYYGENDLTSFVVSPFCGGLLPKRNFQIGNMDLLPQPLIRYKIGVAGRQLLNIKTPLTVQDPFVLNYNVGAVTSAFILDKFKNTCAYTSLLIKDETEKGRNGPCLLNIFKQSPVWR